MTDILPNIWSFPDSYVEGLFDKMEAAGRTRAVFSDQSVRNAAEFYDFFQPQAIKSFVVELHGEPISFFWFDQFMQRRCNMHFCTFPGHTLANVRAARRVFAAMEKMPVPWVHAVFGVISAHNTPAMRFAALTGMNFEGILPAYLYDAYAGENLPGAVFLRRIRRDDNGR